MIEIEFEEGKNITAKCVCAQCQSPLVLAWGGAYGVQNYVVYCGRDREHEGFLEKETALAMTRRGEGVPLYVEKAVEKKLLPKEDIKRAIEIVKLRYPRCDLDDASAALFILDCLKLDLDPLLGEIVPVSFKVGRRRKGKKVLEEEKIAVVGIITEDGWLSLASRACPEKWIGPPTTLPIYDSEFKKNICNDEEAWVWEARGKVRVGGEFMETPSTYGWVKKKEWLKAQEQGTPVGELPGNQARVRSIKRWVKENFPEAKKRMMEMTREWMVRAEGVREAQRIIDAEYSIFEEEKPTEPPKEIQKPEEEQRKLF